MKAKRKKIFEYTQKKVKEDSSFFDKVKASWRMINAHSRKEYKIESKTFFFVLGAIFYTIVPIDFDWIPIAGWIDDLTILTFAFNRLNKEIINFLQWEAQKKPYSKMNITDAEIIE